jgi:hypothetical protein
VSVLPDREDLVAQESDIPRGLGKRPEPTCIGRLPQPGLDDLA